MMIQTNLSPTVDLTPSYRQWQNWAGNQRSTPTYTSTPETEQDFVDTVRFALKQGLSIRPMGSGLSFSPLVQTGSVLLDTSRYTGITGVDSAKHRARVKAGMVVKEMLQKLWDLGLSMENQGGIRAQSIAGALSTSTHGTGKDLRSLSSQMTWVRLVNGEGEIVEIDESTPDLLHAAQTAMGTMGVFLEVELQLVPRYYMAENLSYIPWADARRTWHEDLQNNRHHSHLWFPTDNSPGLYGIPADPRLPAANTSLVFQFNPIVINDESELDPTTYGARRDRAYQILSGDNLPPVFDELEYNVPIENAEEAVAAVQELFYSTHNGQENPMFVRFIKGDEAFMSPFYKRDAATISVSSAPNTNYWPFFQDVDRILSQWDARAHWGKLHLMTRERLESLYPKFGHFSDIRKQFDPQGVFLNDHLRSLLT